MNWVETEVGTDWSTSAIQEGEGSVLDKELKSSWFQEAFRRGTIETGHQSNENSQREQLSGWWSWETQGEKKV